MEDKIKEFTARVKSITNGKSVIGITVLVKAEDYVPIDSRELVIIKQVIKQIK